MSDGFVSIPVGLRSNAHAVRVPKTAELIARQIRNAIIRGDLSDGDMLPAEIHLIAEFEVSRPTIREAVRILESEGLLSVARGARGGGRINSPSFEMVSRAAGITLQTQGVTIGDLYEMRTLIEPAATRLVAERNSVKAVPLLRAQVEKELNTMEDRDAVRIAIAEFDRLLIELAGNMTLVLMWQAVAGLVNDHMRLAQRRASNINPDSQLRQLRRGLKSQSKLIDFIEAKDGFGAAAHWKTHMLAAGKIWLRDVGPTSLVDLLE